MYCAMSDEPTKLIDGDNPLPYSPPGAQADDAFIVIRTDEARSEEATAEVQSEAAGTSLMIVNDRVILGSHSLAVGEAKPGHDGHISVEIRGSLADVVWKRLVR